jgi:hypothetical protein
VCKKRKIFRHAIAAGTGLLDSAILSLAKADQNKWQA